MATFYSPKGAKGGQQKGDIHAKDRSRENGDFPCTSEAGHLRGWEPPVAILNARRLPLVLFVISDFGSTVERDQTSICCLRPDGGAFCGMSPFS